MLFGTDHDCFLMLFCFGFLYWSGLLLYWSGWGSTATVCVWTSDASAMMMDEDSAWASVHRKYHTVHTINDYNTFNGMGRESWGAKLLDASKSGAKKRIIKAQVLLVSATDAQPLAGSGGGGFEGSFYGGVGTNDNNYHDLPSCPPQDVIHVRPPMIFVIYVTSDIN